MLEKSRESRATIVIAHRLSTIRSADEIIVLNQGNVVERGTHDELVKLQGSYHGMLLAQARSNDPKELDIKTPAALISNPEGRVESDVKVADNASALKGHGTAETAPLDAPAKDDNGEPLVEGLVRMKLESEDENIDDAAHAKAARAWAWGLAKADSAILFLAVMFAAVAGCGIPVSTVLLAKLLFNALGHYEDRDYACNATTTATIQVFDSYEPCFDWCHGRHDCWGCTPEVQSGELPGDAVCSGGYVAVSGCERLPCICGCASEQIVPGDESRTNELCLAFVYLAIAYSVAQYIAATTKFYAGERVTARARSLLYDAFLLKSASWHDKYEGQLNEVLAVGAASIRGMYGDNWTSKTQCAMILFGGIGVAFYYCYHLAWVVLLCVPLLIVGFAIEMTVTFQSEEKSSSDIAQESSTVAAVMFSSSKTLTALGRSFDYLDKYREALAPAEAMFRKQAWGVAVAGFITQFTLFGVFGLAFWYGAVQVQDGNCTFEEMFIAVSGVLFCGLSASMLMAMFPDVAAKQAAVVSGHKIFAAEDPASVASSGGVGGTGASSDSVEHGKIEFKDVSFTYPSRPDATVLDGVSMTIEPGQSVALVGPSGSGKSTVLALLQKFYRPSAGTIYVDGVDVQELDTDKLRAQLAAVDQQPRLFSRPVRDNIAYRPQSEPVLDEQIIAAAEIAHAHEFITKLVDGYDSEVGKFGDSLSGGQRQRVAIARSVFGNTTTKVLLLDEATSALDPVGQREVQAALDEVGRNCTTVIIAHRLSTVRAADKIFVLDAGRITETGTFDELVQADGKFVEIYQNQLS